MSWKDCLAMDKAIREAGVKTCVCFRMPLVQPVPGDQGRARPRPARITPLWRGWTTTTASVPGTDNSAGTPARTPGQRPADGGMPRPRRPVLCLGNDVAEVSSYDTRSRSKIFESYEYTTTSVTILKFKGGQVGKCAAVVDCLQPYYFHTHLVGSEGSLLDRKFHSNKLATNRHQWSELSMKMLDSGDVSDHPYQTQFTASLPPLNGVRTCR